jgi:hypothetical protein
LFAGDDMGEISVGSATITPLFLRPTMQHDDKPALRKSRERAKLCETLIEELRTIYRRCQTYCTVEQLKHDYPNFVLWSHITDYELRRLLGGDEFRLRDFAKHLTLRAYNLTSLDTLKDDRRKIRKAERHKPKSDTPL